MKNIVSLLIIASSIFILNACSHNDLLLDRSNINQSKGYLTRSDKKDVLDNPVVSFISKENIPGILRGWLPEDLFKGVNMDKYSLITVSEEGYNLIYVVNFDDGGWVLIAGVMLENGPILGFNNNVDVRPYDPFNIEAPAAAYLFECYKKHILSTIKESRDSRLTNNR